MLVNLPNRERMCSAADESGSCASKHYSRSLVAQAVEWNVTCSCKEHLFGSSHNVGISF
jgi:hypothetical protein